jgi:hypothetical protein
MREEYDFSRASVGKYAARYAKGTNVVLLDSDIADLFPDSKSVNDALRSLVKIVERRARAGGTSTPRGRTRRLR